MVVPRPMHWIVRCVALLIDLPPVSPARPASIECDTAARGERCLAAALLDEDGRGVTVLALVSDSPGKAVRSRSCAVLDVLIDRFSAKPGRIALIGLTIGTYGLYWFNGGFYIGPRYWFMTLWPALFLSARGLQTAAAKLSGIGAEEARQRIALPAIVMGALALVAFLPWRASEKYWNFRSFHNDYRTLVASGAVDNALVFVKTDEVGDWGSAFMLNSPTLDGTIFLRDLGPAANAAIIARYPGRAVHYVTGRSQPTEKKETP